MDFYRNKYKWWGGRGRNVPSETCYIRQILLLDLTEVFPYLPSSPTIPDLTEYISDVEMPSDACPWRNQLAESLGSFQVCFSMYATHSALAQKICFSTSVKLLLCPAEGKYLGQLKCWSNTGLIHAVLFRRWRQGEESKDNLMFSKEAALACLCLSLCKGVCDAWEKQAQRPSLWRDKHPYFNLKWFSP